MYIEKFKKYLKKYLNDESDDDIRKEFIEDLLKVISSNAESIWPSELRDFNPHGLKLPKYV